jgi:hypothetical protein
VNSTTDQERKQVLLDRWLTLFLDEYSFLLFDKDGEVNAKEASTKIKTASLHWKDFDQSLYVLLIRLKSTLVPVYIGKSNNPLNRWQSHIKSLVKGKGSYQRWRSLLLNETGTFKYATFLLIVPDYMIAKPVIPGFPHTVGSIEYQLIGLASDVYPDYLLNLEGNRR